MTPPSELRWLAVLFVDEVRTQLRRPAPWVFAGMYASLGLLLMIAAGGAFEGVQIGIGGGNTRVDSPYAMAGVSMALSLFAVMNVAAVAGGAACRDAEDGSFPLVYTTPIPRRVFLTARFLGSLVVCAVITAGIPVGLLVGAKLPLLEPERFGAWGLLNGLVPYLCWVLPNVLFTAALFFALAAITRRMFPNYIGGVVLLVGYLGAQAVIADLDNEAVSALIDPFGQGALALQTRYWSAHERNTLLPWPVGLSLVNRALWVAVGLGFLATAFRLARFDHDGWQLPALPWRRRAPDDASGADEVGTAVPTAALRFDRGARAAQLVALSRRSLADVLGHRYFWAFVAASVLFQLLNAQVIGTLYGTDTWPVTYQVLEVLESTLTLFVIVVLTFYAGDLVWQERDRGDAPLFDGLPLPDALPLVAKAVALLGVVIGLHATVPVLGVLVQLFAGYTRLEPGLYLASLGMSVIEWVPFVALTLAVHVIVNQKVLGHVLVVLLWVGLSFRSSLGFEYHLLWFGAHPGRTWSDMNGWGTSLGPWALYQALWWAVSLALLVVARLLWVRGADPGFRARLVEARRRLDRGASGVLAVAGVAAIVFAGVIVVQSAVVHPYRSSVDRTRAQVRYEQQYKATWEDAPHPRVTAVDLAVDLFPDAGRVRSEGTLALENRTGTPIAQLLLSTLPSAFDPAEISLSLDRPATFGPVDEALGLRVVTLAPPLEPGGRATLSFVLDLQTRGFDNGGMNTQVVANGSFVHSPLLIPSLGYDRGFELADKAERRKYDLPERRRMRDLDDPVGRSRNYISDDGDWVDFRVVVSTDADQIPLAPGRKVDDRVVDGRRVVTFEAERPILYFFGFLSGVWDVRSATAGDTTIEVYYHPTHTYNVDRMIEATQDSLAAFERRFSPFQYGQIRIVEFPRYATYAQSFPSNVPFSEAIGFVARLVDPDEDIDYPYYITAHEVAHQWWAHQVISADTQGATVLVETLAQYSAITEMKAKFGADHVHRFLRYEQDRYFQGRAVERDREVPLLRVENQGYIHYQKGGVVMYALAEAVGQDRLDGALRVFLERWRDTDPPYPTARDLLDHLRVTLPEAQDLLTDTFERIVLYQNRATSATAAENADGTWTVTMQLVLGKREADEVGEETELPVDEEMEIGVFAGTRDAREPLLVERRRLQGPEATVTVTVPSRPTLAGVDPNHLLLDQRRDDNLVAVTHE